MKQQEIIIKTFQGLEDILAKEVKSLSTSEVLKIKRGVKTFGDISTVYKLNLHLRTALRVLIPIEKFNASNEHQLYGNAFKINWEKYLKLDQTFAIDTIVYSKIFKHSKYASLKIKDAIADKFKHRYNKRPNVDVINPDVRINVHITENRVIILLDSSGDSLHRRGYRTEGGKAPINEVLAAGIIKMSGWDGNSPLLDPMCGSGTIPIEAAMIANNIVPGAIRKNYGFMNWWNFNVEEYKKLIEDFQPKKSKYKISGSDIDFQNVRISRENARRCGLEDQIKFTQADFFDSKGENNIMIISNPPYGERIQNEDLIGFYKNIGDKLKTNYAGSKAWIISSNMEAIKNIGLRPSEKKTVFNGPLECKLIKIELFKGSKYKQKTK